MPLEQKISRLAATFAARIVGALTAAPVDELLELASSRELLVRSPKATRARRTAKSSSSAALRAPAASATPATPAEPSAEQLLAALSFFRERGARGATAPQLGQRLSELGLAGSARAPADVVARLAGSGEIRDAGFRRAAGKNATASVFVAT
jgi:hypothetical protein